MRSITIFAVALIAIFVGFTSIGYAQYWGHHGGMMGGGMMGGYGQNWNYGGPGGWGNWGGGMGWNNWGPGHHGMWGNGGPWGGGHHMYNWGYDNDFNSPDNGVW